MRGEFGAIDFIGHSLGGALAQWFGSRWTQDTNHPSGDKLIDEMITFNSPGISNSAVAGFGASEANSVTHYVVNGDVVSMAGLAYLPCQAHMAS